MNKGIADHSLQILAQGQLFAFSAWPNLDIPR